MIKQLRKKHLFIWRLLALLLPAGIIIAWLAVPKQSFQVLLQPGSVNPLPVILKKIEKENYTISVRSNEDTSQLQLEWVNKAVLQYPTATIYAGSDFKNINTAKLIGRIEARGNWYFSLDSTFKKGTDITDHFILYDFIHQQVIDTINFKP
jgi:hypothetical protein